MENPIRWSSDKQRLAFFIKKLADIDPIYESYQGDSSCFFCGSFKEGKDGEIIHEEDCAWLLAKREVSKDTFDK